jgi:hypothetical protein
MLASLDVEESVMLKLKLILIIAGENIWLEEFEKLRLSNDVAKLLSVLFKSH